MTASHENRTTLSDGTTVACWLDGGIWRARVEHAGPQFVRLDTCEQVRDRIPTRHWRKRASITTDVLVFIECSKSAEVLGSFARWRGE
jgi:hypothetical protein